MATYLSPWVSVVVVGTAEAAEAAEAVAAVVVELPKKMWRCRSIRLNLALEAQDRCLGLG